MKGGKDKRQDNKKMVVPFRLSVKDMERLDALARMAGMSRSEYIRQRVFGGRPLMSRTDLSTVAELRRLGGLLKHNFQTLRETNAPPGLLETQEETLKMLKWAIHKIGLKVDGRQENQEW